MPLRFRQRILDHVGHDSYRPQTADAIAHAMRVEPDEASLFDQAVALLEEEGRIELDDAERVHLPAAKEELIGRIKVTSRGFGFVMPQQTVREGDIFIPPGNLSDAVTGDTVRVQTVRRKGKSGEKSLVGRVIEIVERGQSKFVGVLKKEGREWWVVPDGTTLRDPVIIRDPHAKNAKPGDKVAIELLHYPEEQYYAEGVITEVLGEAGKPSVETRAVITAHGLREKFPDEALDEARDASRSFDAITPEDLVHREDLRDTFTLTIDPPDAKDFDDAISIAFDTSSNEWTLGVHIADVAHFVTPGSALDAEAYERGNSVYLPRLVLPMLPESLSNGVCSLQEGVPRFTKSMFITYDAHGNVQSQRAMSTVIQSRKRLTYLEAQALIDGDEKEARTHARTEPAYSDELIHTLRQMDQLARVLRKRRQRDGMIALNLPAVELQFDDDGHVIDAHPEDDSFTHTLIEMFMVEANEAVARLFDDLGVPLIRRVHPDPSVGRMDTLQIFAMVAGRKIPETPTRKDLQALLEATHDSPAARAIHFAVLRTLTKASYSPALIGHYALASEHYTHFTSPIRRYPDLTVHRALAAFLERTDNGSHMPGGRKRRSLGEQIMHDDRVLDEAQLIQLGTHCSESEQNAESAERELTDFLVMQFLSEHHLGDIFPGVVTGVSSAGVFVSIQKFIVEGLVKAEDITPKGRKQERWRVMHHIGRLVSQESGRSIGIGDAVKVQIVAIDLASRLMDLHLTEAPFRQISDKAKRHEAHPRGGPKGKGKRTGNGHGKGKPKGKGGRRR